MEIFFELWSSHWTSGMFRTRKIYITVQHFRVKVKFYLMWVQYPWCHCFLCLSSAQIQLWTPPPPTCVSVVRSLLEIGFPAYKFYNLMWEYCDVQIVSFLLCFTEPCRKRTRSGDCCSFPFIYRSRLYNKCYQYWLWSTLVFFNFKLWSWPPQGQVYVNDIGNISRDCILVL